MHYALLIYADETIFPSKPEEERTEIFAAYRAYREMLEEAGAYCGSMKLTDTITATSVQADGPERRCNRGLRAGHRPEH